MSKQYDANRNEILEGYTIEQKMEYYQLVAQTALLAVLVNNETDYCAFWEYHGHVSWVQIQLRESKENYQRELMLSEFDNFYEKRYSFDKEPDYKLADLRKKRAFLEYILELNDIPYAKATSEIITYTEKVWSF